MTSTLAALGGLGEFGANCWLFTGRAGERIVIDTGAAFSDHAAFGVGHEVPDFGAVEGQPPTAIVLTHAHDDHIKALPDALAAWPDATVFANRPTLAWARALAAGHPTARAEQLTESTPTRVGHLSIEAMPVSHSIPGAIILRIEGDDGCAVLASDLRLMPSALGETTSLEALARWGDRGVDCLLLDATNALIEATPPSEETVASTLAELVRAAHGRVVIVTFASHIGRFRQAALAAAACGRVVVPVGRGLLEALALHGQVADLRLPIGLVRHRRELAELPASSTVVVATGSQGEPGSAFSRLASNQSVGLALRPGDVVFHAARAIPGNERRLLGLFDRCVAQGARVLTAADAPIHASGHPHRHELATLIGALRPRVVVPIHGRRRNLCELADLARSHGVAACVAENGVELAWTHERVAPTGTTLTVSRKLIDASSDQLISATALKERFRLARHGLVTALLVRSPGTAEVVVELHTSGVELNRELERRLLAGARAQLASAGIRDNGEARSTMTAWLRAELGRALRRQPLVLAMVVDV
jgi:ribonuclease J